MKVEISVRPIHNAGTRVGAPPPLASFVGEFNRGLDTKLSPTQTATAETVRDGSRPSPSPPILYSLRDRPKCRSRFKDSSRLGPEYNSRRKGKKSRRRRPSKAVGYPLGNTKTNTNNQQGPLPDGVTQCRVCSGEKPEHEIDCRCENCWADAQKRWHGKSLRARIK